MRIAIKHVLSAALEQVNGGKRAANREARERAWKAVFWPAFEIRLTSLARAAYREFRRFIAELMHE